MKGGKKFLLGACAGLLVSLILNVPSEAKLLQGNVEEASSKPTEHCSCLNPNKVQVVQVSDGWQLQDDATPLLTLQTKEAAEAGVAMIKTYNASEICSLGSAANGTYNPSSLYFKTTDGAPSAALAKEDGIKFALDSVKAEQRNGSWKVTSAGDTWLLDFGQDEAAARNAAEIIRYYGFTNQCFVGAPARELMYWHK
jgi:hypothetical protein